jgi:Fe-S oxidoreductase
MLWLIGLEPACVSVFRDELLNLFPQDPVAARLAQQTFTLNEFLVQQDFQPPPLHRTAVVHGHCHHKAVLGMHPEMEMLQRMQLDVTLLDSGCCGMAGTFGMHLRHYDTSMRIGEAVLLPALRNLQEDVLIVADGFSCREQIIHGTGRRPLHSAQVLQLALSQATFLIKE